ncbi:hypothetical protein CVT24_008532 [Panaeolus cyanescens]|uniref:F-box domain-containing protein n=1 Tax=Panaeolus cyanescens TaxID=181874 RepID=A0A409WEE9_9AGAR|nr:hypothetical protein CVT24_008532 [Panaeolus cyanescens]
MSYNVPIFPPEIIARIIEFLFDEELPLDSDRNSPALNDIRVKGRLATINTCTSVCRVFRHITRPLYFQSVELGIKKGSASERRFDRLLQITSSADSSGSNSDFILRHIRHLCVNMEETSPGELMQHLNSEDIARRISFLLNIPNLRSLSLRYSEVSFAWVSVDSEPQATHLSTPEVTALCNRLVESYVTSTTAILQSLHATKIQGLPYDRIFACKTLHTLSLDECPWPELKKPIPHLKSLRLENMPTYIPLDNLFYMPNLTELSMTATYFERNPATHDDPTHTSSSMSRFTLPYGLRRIHLGTGFYRPDQFEVLFNFLQCHKHNSTTIEPTLPLLHTLSCPIPLSGNGALVPYLQHLPPLQNLSIMVFVPWASSSELLSGLNLDAHLSTGGELTSLVYLSIQVESGIDNPVLMPLFTSFADIFSSITPGSDNNLRYISLTLQAAFKYIRSPRAVVPDQADTTNPPLVEMESLWIGLTAFLKNCSNLPRLQKVTLKMGYQQIYPSQGQPLAPAEERAYAFHLEKHVESDWWEDRSLIESICRMHHDLMETSWQTDSTSKMPMVRRRPTGFTALLASIFPGAFSRCATIVVTFSARG